MLVGIRRRSLAIGLVALVLAALPATASANHSWNGYHWARQSNPFTLKVGDNVSGAWDSVLNTTIGDWTQSSVLNLTKVAGGNRRPKNCRPTSGRDEVCNAAYGNTGWLGVAQVWVTGGVHITQGVVKLNDTYMNSAPYNTTAWRNLVSCQEVGHTLGLDHQDTNFNNTNLGTCMDYTSNPLGPPDNEHPNTHDYDELVTIYSHLDSSTTVGMPTRSAFDGRSWGRELRRDGRESLFVMGDGRGNSVFTFVFWAQ